jgi:CspA family cold shock protein
LRFILLPNVGFVGLAGRMHLRPASLVLFGGRGMAQGTIKKLTDKGFGFIEGERGDIFFHHSALEETTYENLREGQKVEYSEGQGPKGPRAESVRLVE